MLRIHVEETREEVTLRLEGKLVQPWVSEFAKVWSDIASRFPMEQAIHINLEAVSFVDKQGKSTLQMLRSLGCQLEGSGPFIAAVIEEVGEPEFRRDR